MCVLMAKCLSSGGCAASVATHGCYGLGSKCLGCGLVLLAPTGTKTSGFFIWNEHGQFAGWLIKEPGAATTLQPLDIVTAINGFDPDPDYFEMLAKFEQQPMDFNLTLYRAGQVMTASYSRG